MRIAKSPASSVDGILLPLGRRLAAGHARRGLHLLAQAVGARAGEAAAGLEHVDDFVEAELERALLGARVNGLLREEALLLLQVDDALLDRVGDGELVDDDVDRLVQAVDAIDGLFLDKLGHGRLVCCMSQR